MMPKRREGKERPFNLRLVAPEATGNSATVMLDGVDISARVTAVTVDVSVNDVNRATITYACVPIEIEGEFKVSHRCGLEVE